MLYEDVVEVSEWVVLQQDKCQLAKKRGLEVVTGTTGEKVCISFYVLPIH